MSRQLIPIYIRPHLVAFLFQEFPGLDAKFMGHEVKAVKVSVSNSLGKLIRLMAKKSDKPVESDQKYSIFLSVSETTNEHQIRHFGKIYRYQNGIYSYLKIPQEGVLLINDHLESLFSTSMMFYVQAFDDSGQGIRTGINAFVEKYRLLEFGFDPESLRRKYYRWRKKNKRMSFVANQTAGKSFC